MKIKCHVADSCLSSSWPQYRIAFLLVAGYQWDLPVQSLGASREDGSREGLATHLPSGWAGLPHNHRHRSCSWPADQAPGGHGGEWPLARDQLQGGGHRGHRSRFSIRSPQGAAGPRWTAPATDRFPPPREAPVPTPPPRDGACGEGVSHARPPVRQAPMADRDPCAPVARREASASQKL